MLKWLRQLTRYSHREWRIRQDPIGYARSIGVEIGDNCRLINLTAGTFGSEPYLISPGNHVTITSGVKFITHDGGVWVFREQHPDIDVIAPITIGNNVFVGVNSIILPGVSIGDNCIVGAGSIVSRSIDSGMVVAGGPARPIGTIDEYWEKVQSKALFVRTMPADEKQIYLRRLFLE